MHLAQLTSDLCMDKSFLSPHLNATVLSFLQAYLWRRVSWMKSLASPLLGRRVRAGCSPIASPARPLSVLSALRGPSGGTTVSKDLLEPKGLPVGEFASSSGCAEGCMA